MTGIHQVGRIQDQKKEKRPMRIAIGTPHGNDFEVEYVTSLFQTMKDIYADWIFLPIGGCYIYQNRNIIMWEALEREADYLLFIDTDMFWQPQDVITLVQLQAPLATALYCTKDSPFPPCLYNWKDMKIVQMARTEVPAVPFRVDIAGFGFFLMTGEAIRRFMDEKALDEWGLPFDPIAGPRKRPSGFNGEDISFCFRAEKVGLEIICHPEVRVGHVGRGRIHFRPEADAPLFDPMKLKKYDG